MSLVTYRPPCVKPLRQWRAGTLVYSAGGLAALFGWLLWGDFAWTMKERAAIPLAQLTLRNFTAPDWLIGLMVWSVPEALKLLLGPVVSTRSDRHRGKWGRRIPYLLLPTPFITLAMVGLAASSPLGDGLARTFGLASATGRLVAFGGCWLVFEVATTIVNILFGALANDVVPPELIGRFFALFRAVNLAAASLFNLYLMGSLEAHAFGMFLGLGVLYGGAFSLMCFRVREGDYPPPVDLPSEPWLARVRRYVRECFAHPFYRCFFVTAALGSLAFWPVNTFSLFHARSVGLSDEAYGRCLAISYLIAFVCSYPLGHLADRFHPLRVALVVMLVYCGVTIGGFVLATTARTFFWIFVAHTVVAGAHITATLSLGPRLLPRQRFGQFNAAALCVIGFCQMLLPPALGFLVEASQHNYRYVFLVGAAVAGASAIAYVVLLRRFVRLGGDRIYVAP